MSQKDKYVGAVDINGKKYNVEVRNGERFIDGKTVEEFMKTLDENTVQRAARVGRMAIKDELGSTKYAKGKYQYYINEPLQ